MMLISDKASLKEFLNKYIFSLHLKLVSVSVDLTDLGRLFHTVGPAMNITGIIKPEMFIRHVLLLSCYRKKPQNLSHLSCGL